MSYTYAKVEGLENSPMVGSHQCVALVREYAGTPATHAWTQGTAVLGNRSLKKGTAIATFTDGKYAGHSHGNHAALYIGPTANGILVMDQWRNKTDKVDSSRIIRSKGKNKAGVYIDPSDNADAFFVIE